MNNNKFNWRSFISFGLAIAFIAIFVTGIVLYIAPPGRIAHWTNWKIWALTKEEWQAIHITFSLMFVILSIFHLFSINWKVFISYIKSKTSAGINKKKELATSTIVSLIVLTGTIYAVPPFSSVIELSEYFKETWETTDSEPPAPHTELLSLEQLAIKLEHISLEQIENKLKHSNIKYNSTTESLTEIGKHNDMPPMDIYNKIVNGNSNLKQGTNISGKAGAGMGRKTLEQLAVDYNKDIQDLINILESHHINATKDQTLRSIAEEHDMATRDLVEMLK
ncbi:DUF4405 domain-containing protein [Plebeiibacterium marinum]|uniref:DUF4405 domain-containing protein n=1 Tax=Plebeiibacterium marinum TaxID=2992111 RepID=A0AAE3MAC0_9BACT|nr:DUF4405 domain-containing protein [Plebeiobacterium marinum]MCW3804030.1 DUF4405 domain-containing protein [Plebeiobacterium marinum]